MTAHATPVLFGKPSRPLFGWVHQRDDLSARATAIICPPMGREYFNVHNTYRVLAESLAEMGITAIRFDYDGTGDSVGDETDPDRIAAHLDSIAQAIELAEGLGTTSLALVGMRMGGLFAALAAERCGEVDGLVLWDPCTSGRSYLREQTALFRVKYGKTDPANGQTEVPGFLISEQTAKELSALKPPEALPKVQRALVINRVERPSELTYGVEPGLVEIESTADQGELMDVEPFFNRMPPTVHRVASWLDDVLPKELSAQSKPDCSTSLTTANRAGITVTERLVRLGPSQMFGITTTTSEAATGPLVIFLNSGTDPHIGPNRLWVTLAREWAGLGFRCLRFDLSGIGDSPPREGHAPFVAREPEAFDDVADVLTALNEGTADPAPVVLVGLCSGAYQALESGLELAPRSVIAINPVLRFEPPETKTGPLDPRRHFCRPSGNLRSAYYALPSWKVLKMAKRAYIAMTRLKSRGDTMEHWLEQMSVQGTDVLCICGEEEAEAFFQGVMPEQEDLYFGERSHLKIIEGLDHALIPAAQRADVTRMLTNYVTGLDLMGNSKSGNRRSRSAATPQPISN